MAKIEYKSKEEHGPGRTFNPYESPIFKIEQDLYQLNEIFEMYVKNLRETLYRNHVMDENEVSYDVEIFTVCETDTNKKKRGCILPVNVTAAEEHLNKIMEGALNSAPFDEIILFGNTIKFIDELKIEDFMCEDTFRECLEHYYFILWVIHDIDRDFDAIIDKIEEKLSYDFIYSDLLLDKLYDGCETNLNRRGKIYYLVTHNSPTDLEFMIENEKIKYFQANDVNNRFP